MTLHALMFHHFFDDGIHPKGQGAISAEEFERILLHVGLENILSAQDFLRHAEQGTLLPHHRCITLDDGLLCQYSIAYPVLKKLGLTAFWFVYSSVLQGNIEHLEIHRYFRTVGYSDIEEFYSEFFEVIESRYSDAHTLTEQKFNPSTYLAEWDFYTDNDRRFRFIRDQALGPDRYRESIDYLMALNNFDVAEAAKSLWVTNENILELHSEGHAIGLHSHTHPTCLANLNPEQQQREYQLNYDHLKAVLGENPRSMAHPCNSYNQSTLDILEDLNIVVGFCSNTKEIKNRTALELKRMDHIDLLKAIS